MAIETLAVSTVESPLNPVRVSRPARPVARRAAGQRRAQAPRTSGCDRPLHRPHVMSEEIFRSVLLRERRRADRFNQPFLLFLVGVEKQPDAELPALPPAVVDALGAVTRDTDVLGWFRGQSVLGLIVPEVGSAGVNLARDVEARILQGAGASDRRRRPAPDLRRSPRAHADDRCRRGRSGISGTDCLVASPCGRAVVARTVQARPRRCAAAARFC